jgi:hypothetical protein
MLKNRDILMELLQDANDFAKMKQIECPPIYLMGGSGCILGNYLERATTDIDLIDMGYLASVGKVFRLFDTFDMLDLYVTPIADGFEARAIVLEGFDRLQFYILSVEDMIVSKLGRYSEKDQEDISRLVTQSNYELLNSLIRNVSSRENFSDRVRTHFIENAEQFKVLYHV